MEMLGNILVIIISMIIISCDYYNAGMDYQDNIALEQVVTLSLIHILPRTFQGCPRAELCLLADGWLAKQRRSGARNKPFAGDMAGTANCADGASAGEPEPGMAGGGK